jgi:hypothetical protein
MVEGAGNAAITGAVTSCTVTVCEAVVVFPTASFAVQVRVTLYEPAQAPGVVTSAEVKLVTAQLSEAVGVLKTGVAGQFIVDGPPTPVIIGFTLSVTVTVKVQVAVPHEFVAVIVTLVIPLLNVKPLPVPLPVPVVAPERL